MAELEKLQLELQEAVRESEKLKVEMATMPYFLGTLLCVICGSGVFSFSDGLAEYSRRRCEGDSGVQMSAVPILTAVQ